MTTNPAVADDLAKLTTAYTPLLEATCARVRQLAACFGVDLGNAPDRREAVFRLQTDPYSGETGLIGEWKGKARYGIITCFARDRVFAEYQLLIPHPQRPRQFIEALQVWGSYGELKSDAVFLEMPE